MAFASHIHPTTFNYETAEKLLDRYRVQESVPCWYDPDNASMVVIEKGYDISNLTMLCGSLLLLFLFTFPFVLIRYADKQAVISSRVSGQYRINNKFFLIEYVYLGDEPVTVETLPKELQNGSKRLKESLVIRINTKGNIVAINKTFINIIGVCVLIVCAVSIYLM